MSRFAVAVAVSVVFTAAACRDQQPLQTRSIASPSYLISDGAHSGNPFFFFLPPLVPNPGAFFHAGTFDAGLAPVVEVCVLSEDPRLHLPPDPNAAHCVGSPVFGPVPMAVDLANQQYTRNWDTKSPAPLDASLFYRIQVRGALGGTVFGFVDVDPVDQGMKNVRTGDVVQFQDGRTLPIKVRIERRAYCNDPNTDCVAKVVGAAGGDVLADRAGVRFFPGNLPGDRVVIVEEIPLKPGERCLPRATDLLEYPPCYRFRTDPGPTTFSRSADGLLPTAAICPDLAALPGSLAGHRQLFQEEGAAGLPDANADFLPCTLTGTIGARTGWRGLLARIFALVTPRPAFAVDEGAGGSAPFFSSFTNAVQSNITAVGLTDQTVARGQVLPGSVRVTAIHPRAGEPLSDVPVRFTTSDGSISTTNPVLTTSDGFATTNWSLPLPAGTSQLTASASAIGSPVLFTASSSASFDFEIYPDETVTCSLCGVTNEFADGGVGFQWQSTFANTNATLADGNGSLYGDAGNLGNHFVTSAVNTAGQGLSGVLTMELPGHPKTVEFDWSTANDVSAFPVTAFDASGRPIPGAQITHTLLRTYTSVGRLLFKWERVSITSPSLIQRVVFDMNGFLQQIDNVSINPVVIP